LTQLAEVEVSLEWVQFHNAKVILTVNLNFFKMKSKTE